MTDQQYALWQALLLFKLIQLMAGEVSYDITADEDAE